MAKILPKEITSLIHHITLNEQGWWDRTIERLLVAALSIVENNQLSKSEMLLFLSRHFTVTLDPDRLNKQIERLLSKKSIIKVSDDKYKLSESELANFRGDISKFEQIEQDAKNIFEELLLRCSIEDDRKILTWESFNSDLLIPILYEFGAKTYELITGKGLQIDTNQNFKKFLSKFPLERHVHIRDIIIGFLNPKNPTVRNLILRKLNAYFFIEAVNLSGAAIDKINSVTKTQPTFKLFIDTNFLFSILGLHENPSNEKAQALINLIQKISNKVKIKLFISPLTIEETRKVIIKEEQKLKNLRPSRLLSKVASDYISNGFAKKYFEECCKSGLAIKAEDYFSPYLNNLVAVLKGKT